MARSPFVSLGARRIVDATLAFPSWQEFPFPLHLVPRSRLDLEGRLEDWLCKDIGLLSDDLLVIGRQIEQYGTPLDLLAVDRDGNLVVVELKRDRTPRVG